MKSKSSCILAMYTKAPGTPRPSWLHRLHSRSVSAAHAHRKPIDWAQVVKESATTINLVQARKPDWSWQAASSGPQWAGRLRAWLMPLPTSMALVSAGSCKVEVQNTEPSGLAGLAPGLLGEQASILTDSASVRDLLLGSSTRWRTLAIFYANSLPIFSWEDLAGGGPLPAGCE